MEASSLLIGTHAIPGALARAGQPSLFAELTGEFVVGKVDPLESRQISDDFRNGTCVGG